MSRTSRSFPRPSDEDPFQGNGSRDESRFRGDVFHRAYASRDVNSTTMIGAVLTPRRFSPHR